MNGSSRPVFVYEVSPAPGALAELERELGEHGVRATVRDGQTYFGRAADEYNRAGEFSLRVLAADASPFELDALACYASERTQESFGLTMEALCLCALKWPARVWLGYYGKDSLAGSGIPAEECELPGVGMGCIVLAELFTD